MGGAVPAERPLSRATSVVSLGHTQNPPKQQNVVNPSNNISNLVKNGISDQNLLPLLAANLSNNNSNNNNLATLLSNANNNFVSKLANNLANNNNNTPNNPNSISSPNTFLTNLNSLAAANVNVTNHNAASQNHNAAIDLTHRNMLSMQNSLLPVEVQQVFLNQLASGKLNNNVSKSVRKDAAFLAKQLEKQVNEKKMNELREKEN